jgi:hypothetical protein
LLAATAAGSLGLGCTLAGCRGIAAIGPIPTVAPDVVNLEHAIAAEETLVDRYTAALHLLGSAHGTATLAVIRGEHEAHLKQLRARLLLPTRLAKKKISPSRDQVPLPTKPAGVVGALVADERAAVARLTSQLLTAPPAVAQLMASISASEAAHVILLRRVRPR